MCKQFEIYLDCEEKMWTKLKETSCHSAYSIGNLGSKGFAALAPVSRKSTSESVVLQKKKNTKEEQLHRGFSSQGMRQVIIFDDAHEMRTDSLRLARLLTNFEMDSKLVVSVILAGQLPLKKMLSTPELEDVRQRLNVCSELRLFSREESFGYISHRVKIAGATKSPFPAQSSEAIFEITKGNMRAIDALALMSLRVADEGKRSVVSASDVAVARARLWMQILMTSLDRFFPLQKFRTFRRRKKLIGS